MVTGSRICIVTADLLVLLGTWFATYQVKRMANLAKMKVSIVTLLLRDGKYDYIMHKESSYLKSYAQEPYIGGMCLSVLNLGQT